MTQIILSKWILSMDTYPLSWDMAVKICTHSIFLWVLIFEEHHDLDNARIEKHPKQILKWHLGLMYHIFHP